MKIKFNISSEIKKEETIEKVKIVLFDSMVKMHELANLYVPVDTSRLKTSIKLFPSSPGAKSYVLADGVDYGVDVEFGTQPHYVSVKQLTGWAGRVLGDKGAASAVAKKIAQKGTEAQPFFRPALDQVKEVWINRFMIREFGK